MFNKKMKSLKKRNKVKRVPVNQILFSNPSRNYSAKAALNVWYGKGSFSHRTLLNLFKILRKLKKSNCIPWKKAKLKRPESFQIDKKESKFVHQDVKYSIFTAEDFLSASLPSLNQLMPTQEE